ncbi:hypothetical protein [Enterobacter roggenkampii]|uniref:hypothetical protein n=1 Tax=Enterobacteriaceae TaxID=543 RepID=UPI003A102610
MAEKMTVPNEQMPQMTAPQKGLLRSKTFWELTGSALIVLMMGMAGSHALKGVNQRVAQLEQAQRNLSPQDDVASLRNTFGAQQQQVAMLESRQAQFETKLAAIINNAVSPQQLQAQLEAQQADLNALKDDLAAYKKSASLAPTPTTDTPASSTGASTKPSTSVPAAPSATAKITPKYPATPIKSPAREAVRVARKAPFVLTGIERRGTAAFAAVAPQGFSDLSQVCLISEGESVSGWQLVSAGVGQATFRVNGRLQTLNVQ